MDRLPSLSMFFPVHDEEANVVPMATRCLAVLPDCAERFELIIVDDGSTDRTGALADAFAAAHPATRVVRHAAKRGYGAALRSGFGAARHEFVFFTDGDLQFDPAELARLVPRIADADAVVGYRQARADPWTRRLAGRGWNLLLRLATGLRVRDANCAFKLLRRSALARVPLESEGAAISAELLLGLRRIGARVVEVPVRHRPRTRGTPSGGSLRVALRGLAELHRLRVAPRQADAALPPVVAALDVPERAESP